MLRAMALTTTTAAVVAGLLTGSGPGPAYAEPNAADLDRQVASTWQRLETVVEQFDTTRENLQTTRARLAAANAQLAPLDRQVGVLQEKVGTIAAGEYMVTGDEPMSALLGARSPEELLDQLTMLDHIAHGHARDIAALRAAGARYEAERRDLTALAQQQAGQYRKLADTKASVEAMLAKLQALRSRAYGYGEATRSYNRSAYIPIFPPDAGGTALRFAYQQLGKSYQWAAAGPNTYDCSGLVLASWRAAGKSLPHSSQLQWDDVQHIQRADLRPGDLVFYFSDIHHVALYAGDGNVIEAPQSGERVSVRNMDFAPIHGYGRVT
jgi:cell wall-associated NlpC family hydrolase